MSSANKALPPQGGKNTTAYSRKVDELSGDLKRVATEGERASRRNRLVAMWSVIAYLLAMLGFIVAFPPNRSHLKSARSDPNGPMCLWDMMAWILYWFMGWTPRHGALDMISEENLEGIRMLHCVALGMFAALGMAEAVAGCVDADTSQGRMNAITFGVSVIGATCYALMATGSVPVMFSLAPGRVVYPTRLLTWLFTTSMTLYSCWTMGNKQVSYLLINLACNTTMLALGAICSLFSGWIMWTSFFTAMTFFCLNGYLRHQMFSAAMADDGQLRAGRAVFRLGVFMEAICCVFPASWILQFTSISDFWLEAIVITADVAAKAMMPAMQQAVVLAASDRKHSALMKMSQELVKDLREQGARNEHFFAAMIQELRPPVDGIVCLLDSVLMVHPGGLRDKVARALTSVRDTGRRLKLVLSTILDASSAQGGNIRMNLRPVSIYEAANEVAVLIEPLMRSETRLALYIPKGLPTVDADPFRLSQVLFNILGNAVKLTSRGEVSLTASVDMGVMMRIEIKGAGRAPVPYGPDTSKHPRTQQFHRAFCHDHLSHPHFRWTCLNCWCLISGIGIPAGKHKAIVEPFEQLDDVRKRSWQANVGNGTGLGLSLAQSLVESHGGKLAVRSEQGKGSTVTILIPLKAQKKPEEADLLLLQSGSGMQSGEGLSQAAAGATRVPDHGAFPSEAPREEAGFQDPLHASVLKRTEEGEELIVDQLESVTVLCAEVLNLSEMASKAWVTDSFLAIHALVKRMDASAELHGMRKVRMSGEAPPSPASTSGP